MSDTAVEKCALALLLAAHGERSSGAMNAGIARLAADLRGRHIVQEVAIGFIKGIPTITESVRALHADEILVYPLFLADGYFTRTRLPELLQDASAADRHRRVRILPPLGLHPSLAPLIVERLVGTARARGIAPAHAAVILLSHGSRTDPASRNAAELIAAEVRQRASFLAVRVALLEESPSLREAASDLSGAIFVFGLFAGEGMHGAGDAPRLVEELRRADAVFAGNVASLDGIADLIAAAVARARLAP
ncbi:MAG TPA: CbiX/SirB N-terminal domain-containing protein [Xanthobacteraceae bacterium]